MSFSPAVRALFEEMTGLYGPVVHGALPSREPFDALAERLIAEVDKWHRPGRPHPVLQAWADHWIGLAPGSEPDVAMSVAFHRLALSNLGSVGSLYLSPSSSAAWNPDDQRRAWHTLCPPDLADHLLSPPGSPRLDLPSADYMTSTWWAHARRRLVALTPHMIEARPGWEDSEQQQSWRRSLLDGVLPTAPSSTNNKQIATCFGFLLGLSDQTLLTDPCLSRWEHSWSANGEVLALWRDHRAQDLLPARPSRTVSRHRA